MVGRAFFASFAAAVVLTLVPAVQAAPGLFVGVADDYLKSEPSRAASAIRELGFSAVRLTLDWSPGQASLGASEQAALRNAVTAGSGLRIVVAAFSRTSTPLTETDRDQYCSYLRSIASSFPAINDFVVWNEPNKTTFWKRQFEADGSSAAPRDYARLLARCYQVLHAARPGINVIHAGLSSTGNDRPDASSNVSHSPGNFLRREGEALRALLPRARLFDTFGMHPYGESSSEPPWKVHSASSTLAIGDWSKLMQTLRDSFRGTAQPHPGGRAQRSPATGELEPPPPIWYLETGFQTEVAGGPASLYTGNESDPGSLPPTPGAARALLGSGDDAVTQASQLTNAIRRSYCQPSVGAYFNFLLVDERELGRWQSGPLYADWTPKPSVPALKQVIAEVRERRVDCSALTGGPVDEFQESSSVEVTKVEWPKSASFNWKNDLWRFRIQTGEGATYAASILRLGGDGGAAGRPVLRASGELKKLYFSIVKFPTKRLPPGRYRIEVVLTSVESADRATTLRSPVFTVERKQS